MDAIWSSLVHLGDLRMDLNDEDRDLIVGALDSLGIALSQHDHLWTDGEKCVYEAACEILTGSKQLPRDQYFEREPEEGEEWKG